MKSNEPAVRGQGVLCGVQLLWLGGNLPDGPFSIGRGSAALIIASGLVCLLLFWNILIRKRLTNYSNDAAKQDERYRQFFENCPDALLVLEHEGSIVTANTHACSLLKVEGQDLLAENFWSFVVEGVTRAEFSKQFSRCIAGEEIRSEGFIKATDGTVVPVIVNGSLQRIRGKSLVQLYIRDNTVLREVEEQVRSLYNQLEEATAEVGEKEQMVKEEARLARKEFAAFTNHQLRTPLDGIMGMAQLLADTPLNIEQHNGVYAILKSSGNLLNVVRSMNEAPEEVIEETELQAELVDLRKICETLSGHYEPWVLQKGIDFRWDCRNNVPSHVVTDEKLLCRVLSSLLANAVKYTDQGLVMLNIECRQQSADDAELYFHVIDTGVGIAKELQSSVFKKSDAENDNWFMRWEGSEMSLASCRQVVERMGGTIDLTSTEGKGSTFYFSLTLPLALPEPAAEPADRSKPTSTPAKDDLPDALVLVVDDNKISQKVVASMLRKAGYKVDSVENGKEALSRVKNMQYDVILMDCQMPVMDGYKATARIRALAEPLCSIPIIALTAHSLKHELQACLDCGMDGHLVKPVDRQLMLDAVKQYALKGRRQCAAPFKAAS